MLLSQEVVHAVRSLAESHVARYGSFDHAPTDVVGIAHQLDVHVVVESIPSSYTGSAFWTPDGFTLIVVNRYLPMARRLFTVAHELGHIVLEHRPPRHEAHERAANVYASELLMPTRRVLKQIRCYGPNARYLAGLNGVSLTAMQWRLLEVSALLV